MTLATITSHGRVTIPKTIREHLHLAAGDKVDFRVEEDGSVRLVSLARSVHELLGVLRRPGRKPVSVEAMDAAIADGREEADRRTRTSGRNVGETPLPWGDHGALVPVDSPLLIRRRGTWRDSLRIADDFDDEIG